jgi:hypothetical protein
VERQVQAPAAAGAARQSGVEQFSQGGPAVMAHRSSGTASGRAAPAVLEVRQRGAHAVASEGRRGRMQVLIDRLADLARRVEPGESRRRWPRARTDGVAVARQPVARCATSPGSARPRLALDLAGGRFGGVEVERPAE